MQGHPTGNEMLNFSLNVSKLSGPQIRLLRAFNLLMLELLEADKESDFFDKSSELVRLWVLAVRSSNFSLQHNNIENIAYTDQAIEFSLDSLMEFLNSPNGSSFDN